MVKKELRRPDSFNPLDTANLGESVAEAMFQQPVSPLPPNEPFIGAGIYALYYVGNLSLYEEIAQQNRGGQYLWPIYVGKAVPAGARKGGYGFRADPGQVLFKRLNEHASSIRQAKNLTLSNFRCRFLVVDDIWIPLAESLLIETCLPLWNRKIDGFGNHDPGKGRYNQQRSQWDAIHPGRSWAYKLRPPSMEEHVIRAGAAAYLAQTRAKILAQQEDSIDEK
jgi:hypothetical protein